MQSVLLWLLLCVIPSIPGQAPKREKQEASGKRVVCYYSNWSVYRPGTAKFSPQNINPYLCTHLIYAFGGLDKEHGLKPFDKYQDIEQGGYTKFNGLKAYNKALVTLLAIGGWNEGSARFSPLVADPERRGKFVKNAISFLRQHNFDGLDLDWEYPAFRDGGKSHDRENYAKLVQELREEFEKESAKTGRKRLLLTMAVPAGIKYLDKGYDIPKLNKNLDFMNLLTYDYHSAFEPTIRHHSPLYNDDDSDYNYDNELNIDSTVKYILLKGASESKLVVGIPTYGRSYTISDSTRTTLGSPADGPGEQGSATREKGFLAYHEICSSIQHDNWTVSYPKESAMGPVAYKDNQWVGYDDEAIVKTKALYVKKRNLGGIMFWSLDNDDFRGVCHKRAYPLVEAGKEVLLGSSGSKSSSNKLTSERRPIKLKTVFTTTPKAPSTPSITTPVPPTTPDPGSDFVCKDEGFFPHPRDCKKYFWCLDSGPSNLGIVAHQFTCPSGLYFNKAADSCDFARNVLCNKKKATTTTTTAKPETETKKSVSIVTSKTSRTTTTTTTTTTTPEPEFEPEEEEPEEDSRDDHSEEDPETIRQLIALIKKLGGVAELEKQLDGSNNHDSNTKGISRSLVDRFKNIKPQSYHRNEAIVPHESEISHKERHKKPQYVSIRNHKVRTSKTDQINSEEEDEEIELVNKEVPKPTRPQYVNFRNYRPRNLRNESLDSIDEEITGDSRSNHKHIKPQYVTLRSKINHNLQTQLPGEFEDEDEYEDESYSVSTEPVKPTRPQYVTLRSNRYRTTPFDSQDQSQTPSRIPQNRLRTRKPQYVNIRNQKDSRKRTKEPEVDSIEDSKLDEEEQEDVKTERFSSTPSSRSESASNRRNKPVYQRLNRFRPSYTSNDLQDMLSTTSAVSTETVIIRATPTVKPSFPRQPSLRSEQIEEPLEEELDQEVRSTFKPSRPQYATIRSNNFIPSRRIRPQTQIKVEEVSSDDYYTDDLVTEKEVEITTTSTTTTTQPPPTTIQTTSRIRRPTSRAPFLRRVVSRTTTTAAPVTRKVQRISASKDHERPHSQLVEDRIIKYTTLSTPKRFSSISPTHSSLTSGKSTVRSDSPRSSFTYDDYEEEYYTDPIDIPLSGKVRIHTDGYIECLDVGNFPHPFSCRKFISCAKMENGHLLGWEYTCPKGLSFDPIGSICNWNAGLGCKE